jgi:short-subunit dehydrogenase
MSNTKLKGKLILLTGASGGIGQAIARRLAMQGAQLILVGRSSTVLHSLAAELNSTTKTNNAFVLQADITSNDGREIVRTALLALQQPLDGLINCAGIGLFGTLQDSDPEKIDQLITTNITSLILLTRLSLPFLNSAGSRVLTIGSSFGGLGYPCFSIYCATKFAQRGFSQALRRELGGSNIQVAYLAPRATRTSLNSEAVCAMNNALGNTTDEPKVVAMAVEKMLLSKKMRDTNMGWPERFYLFVNSIFPQIIDEALRKKLSLIFHYAKGA